MSTRRRNTSRVKIDFSKLEGLSSAQLAGDALAEAAGCKWKLTEHSALYRCRNGLYTLCLIWHGPDRETLTKTIRGIKLEVA